MVDVERTLKNTVKKGCVHFGAKQTKQALQAGTAKLIVFASNAQEKEEITSLSNSKNIPVFSYDKNSVNLGYACGKHFAVSVLAILEGEDSAFLQLVKQKK